MSAPAEREIRAKCPSCKVVQFHHILATHTYDEELGEGAHAYSKDYNIVNCRMCDHTHFLTIEHCTEWDDGPQHTSFVEVLPATSSDFNQNQEDVFCLEQHLLDCIPDHVRTICKEVVIAAKHAIQTPLLMALGFRAILQAVCKDVLKKDKGHLHEQLQALPSKLKENNDAFQKHSEIEGVCKKMGIVRVIGNDGAHMNSSYLNVTSDEIANLANLIKNLLQIVYLHPARIKRSHEDVKSCFKAVKSVKSTHPGAKDI